MARTRRATLSRRLAVAFAIVAAITMVLAASILSIVWAQQFDAYIQEGLQTTADGAAQLLGHSYEETGRWSMAAFSQLPRYGVLSGFALQVLEANGRVIYDDSDLSMMNESFAGAPLPGVREPEGPVVVSPIIVNGEVVGFVRVWTLNPRGLLTDSDLEFRRKSFLGLAAIAVIAVGLASVAGLGFAVTLVRPIDHITETAESLRSGESDARTGMDGKDAIGILGRTLDEMADAIEADRAMERRLTADVAHELRTPLQAIQATVEAMQDGVLPADEERLATVRNETVRLARLADGILELARLERGAIPVERHRIDVSVPVRAAIDAHRALLESCELSLTVDVGDGLFVDGDVDRLTQAVGNLLSNAARYTPPGGSVSVVCRAEGDRVVVEVADTGVGISPCDAEHVFDRFWRADAARRRATGGLGIGLAIVKEIVERHAGTVAVRPRQGGGSVFAIRLPRAGSLTGDDRHV